MLARSEIIARYEAYCHIRTVHGGWHFQDCKSGLWIKEVDKGLVALDIREQTVAWRLSKQVLDWLSLSMRLFSLKDLVADKASDDFRPYQHDIAVYDSHTNIDVVEDGLNDWFCQLLDEGDKLS